jgi:hypothetical protein
MYSKANKQIDTTQTVSKLELVSQVKRASEEGVTNAIETIDELLKLDASAFRLKESAKISKSAVDSAEQWQVYDIIRAGLKTAPKTTVELQNYIEGQSKWNWDYISSDIPKLVEKKYDPVMATDVLDGWKVISHTVATKPNILQGDMAEMYKFANKSYADYVNLYLDYWLDKVPDQMVRKISPKKSDWKSQHKMLQDQLFNGVIMKLDKLGQYIEDAVLKDFEDHIPEDYEKANQFRANKGKLKGDKNETLHSIYKGLLKKWKELSEEAFEARKFLLNKKPDILKNDYFFFVAKSPAEFVDWYWTILARESLSTLVKQVQAEQARSIDKLKAQYSGKFPLAKDSTIDLTQKEYGEAYELYSKSGLEDEFESKTVGVGEEIKNEELDNLFKSLRSSANEDEWALKRKQLFQALPKPGGSYYCKITNSGDKNVALAQYFTKFELLRGEEKIKILRTLAKDAPLATVKYPDPTEINIDFYGHASAENASERKTFRGPWACLRMLSEHAEPDRGRGCIMIDVRNKEGNGGTLHLKLEFFKKSDGVKIEFPKDSEWPKMKN